MGFTELIAEGAAALGPDLVLALDVGGTKLDMGLVDADGAIVARVRRATPRQGGAADVWSAIASMLRELRSVAPDRRIAAVGCGTGGPMTAGGESVSPLNIGAWRDEPVRSTLAELAQVPAWVDNDAKALALAEGWLGAAAGCDHFMAMVVSTGVGGGIVLDGRLLDGHDGNAGHVGHVLVEPEGRPCGCGARGCLEAEASGTAIAAATGAEPAAAGLEVRRRAGAHVGRAVATVANLLDLPLVAVAGSVALGYGEDFFDAARTEIAQRARLSYSARLRIVPAGCGADGPLIGAAAVGLRGLSAEHLVGPD